LEYKTFEVESKRNPRIFCQNDNQ